MKFMELDIQRFATFSLVVTFNSNTGTGTMSSQIGTSRDDILNTNTFTKEGYIFNGWNTSADGTGISIQEGITLGEVSDLTIDIRGNEDITIYAQWTEDNSNKYVTFGGLKRYDTNMKSYIMTIPTNKFLTSESVIGTWKGKPLYSAYIDNLDLSPETNNWFKIYTHTYSYGDFHIEDVFRITCYGAGGSGYNLVGVTPSAFKSDTSGDVYVYFDTLQTNKGGILAFEIEYTKTTDS